MTRNGKIARLPQAVRRELNQRLNDGEQGKPLVAWLNDLPAVKAVLERDFQGRAVTEQNLSEWRQGGFLEWQRHQEALECVRTAAEQSQELADEAGGVPLTDVLSASVALLLTKLIREVENSKESTSESRAELVTLLREWTAVRQGDHKAARLKMRQSEWNEVRAKAAAAEAKAAEAAEAAAEKANSLEGQLAAFDKKYRRIDKEVIAETQELLMNRTAINAICRVLPEGKRDQLRDKIDRDIKSRQSRMLKDLTVDLLNQGLISEAEAEAAFFVAEDEDDEGDEDGETDENRTESDSIRLNPTEKTDDRPDLKDPGGTGSGTAMEVAA